MASWVLTAVAGLMRTGLPEMLLRCCQLTYHMEAMLAKQSSHLWQSPLCCHHSTRCQNSINISNYQICHCRRVGVEPVIEQETRGVTNKTTHGSLFSVKLEGKGLFYLYLLYRSCARPSTKVVNISIVLSGVGSHAQVTIKEG
jgi:hypothetical protein